MRRTISCIALVAAAAPAHADDAKPGAGTLTRAPAIVEFVAAEYPPDEKAAGRTGSVEVQVDIAADGHVTAATVTRSAGPAFDAAAVAAVLKFKFSPAEIDGKPAPVRILYQYDFKLDTEIVAKTTAELHGTVRERATSKPLPGVTVTLDDGHSVSTDADGHFVFDTVTPGRRTVTLESAQITALHTEEAVEAGKTLDVLYEVDLQPPPGTEQEGDDLELVVTAPKLERATASVEVSAGVARKVPGTGGDVLRVVESMPGVARPAIGSGQLVVWGASPEDTRIYVDGVRIPRLYHTGGLRSVIATDLVRGIELVPGGWDAQHGRSLGALLDVSLAPLTATSAGSVSVDAIDSAAAVRVPVSDRVAVAAAGRRSHLAWLARQVTDEDVGAVFPIPQYYDGQLRLTYERSTRERAELSLIGSSDRVTREVGSADPAMVRSEEETTRFWRAWGRYHVVTPDAAEVDTVVWGGRDASGKTERFGAMPTQVDTGSTIGGVRASWRRTSGRTTVTLGLDVEATSTTQSRNGAITVPAREGDVRVFGQPPPDQVVFDRWHVVSGSAAPYGVVDIALLAGRLHVLPSVRVEPFFVSVSRRTPIAGSTPSIGAFEETTSVQPRVALRFDATPRIRLTLAAGRYRQPAQAADLSAAFGNPLLSTSGAEHVVLGTRIQWTELLVSELTGFFTTSSQLAVRSPSATPRLAEVLESVGEGRTIGVQALVRRELANNVFGWISYTLSRAERTDAPGASARLFDFDQTHVLTALASWTPGHGVEIGGRFRYATGAPRTPVIGAYYDARADLYQPIFGEHNSERLPAFAQLDVRVAKRFKTRSTEGEVYLDLQNVTNRANAEELAYSPDFSSRSTIRGLPFLPVLGARCSW